MYLLKTPSSTAIANIIFAHMLKATGSPCGFFVYNQYDLQHIRNNIAIFHKISPKDISSLGLLFKLQLLLICPLTYKRIY